MYKHSLSENSATIIQQNGEGIDYWRILHPKYLDVLTEVLKANNISVTNIKDNMASEENFRITSQYKGKVPLRTYSLEIEDGLTVILNHFTGKGDYIGEFIIETDKKIDQERKDYILSALMRFYRANFSTPDKRKLKKKSNSSKKRKNKDTETVNDLIEKLAIKHLMVSRVNNNNNS